ncbi:nuclear transport factor 2 family protein [Sphingomonas sp. TZW2008]|uniref:nuclear transport factor 2 family protein n=1 Tax=Sphingomonas sp. TZW2008 TaxID=1917973 RepID=UPI000A271B9C|nr:nuclear transport factor 2 family protein [Sphingomonas sp. TZW2008]
MSLNLPAPIADYIEANRHLDLDGMMKYFAPDAVFTDNGKDFVGQAAIAKMLNDEAIAVKAIFEPDTARAEDGVIVLEGPAHGEFPGSPLRFTYRFAMDGDAIKTLETMVWA